MDLRAYKPLVAAGACWADIAREAGCDWRTAKKYLGGDAPASPPKVAGRRWPKRLVDDWAETIDGWLEKEPPRLVNDGRRRAGVPLSKGPRVSHDPPHGTTD